MATIALGIAELAFGIALERASTGFRASVPRRCSIYQRDSWAHERFWKLSGNYRLLVLGSGLLLSSRARAIGQA